MTLDAPKFSCVPFSSAYLVYFHRTRFRRKITLEVAFNPLNQLKSKVTEVAGTSDLKRLGYLDTLRNLRFRNIAYVSTDPFLGYGQQRLSICCRHSWEKTLTQKHNSL